MEEQHLKKRILVIAPHADDAEFGLGGFLSRITKQDTAEVRVVIMAVGSYGRSDGRFVSGQERTVEATAALNLLGVTDIRFVEAFEENKSRSADYCRIVSKIEEQIASFKATSLFLPLPSFNQDHVVTYEAAMTATRPDARHSLQTIMAYEYPGNSWGLPPFRGNFYLRMTPEDYEKKLQSIAIHASQWAGRKDMHVGPEGAAKLAALRGSECGCDYAELVTLLWSVS